MSISNHLSLMGIIALSVIVSGGYNSSLAETKNDATLSKGLHISMFAKSAFTLEPKIVDCETAEGTATTCYQLVTSGRQQNDITHVVQRG